MKRCWLCCCGLLLVAGVVHAAPAVPGGADNRGPVEISADQLEADDAAKTLVFIGHAMARQGDVTINGDRLTIHYAAPGGDVERIVAEGKVSIVQGSRVATGGKAEYFRSEERIVLSGSPKISDGANSVQGHEIVLYPRENRSVVRSGQNARVNAVFQPKAEGPR